MCSRPTDITVIAGPTGVGKTAISISLAEALGTDGLEIISADSRQVYRQMKVGTARPDDDETQVVPHHFLADRNLDEPYSAGIFGREAEKCIGQILERGHSPLVVGGSTLYLRALTDGLADIPAIEPEVRRQLNERLREEGVEILYNELCTVDANFSSTMDISKSQRIIRGLEVWYGTGHRLSDYFTAQSTPAYVYTYIILDRERSDLYDRINSRVDRMIRRGLVDEVSSILEAGFDPELNALQTIGYREVIRHLNGEWSSETMIDEIKKNTRRYAKRQLTWFRGLSEARWITILRQTEDEITAQILKHLRKGQTRT